MSEYNNKLSDGQKRLLKIMQSGIDIKHYSRLNAFDTIGKGSRAVHAATALSLIRLGIIEPLRSEHELIMNKTYTLTELGKNIKL